MEILYKGIVVGCKNYKENDKIITLFTVQDGLVNIVARGVKKTNAKLKYAKELFTFGDFFVVQKNNFNILTACDVIENFSGLVSLPDNYLLASELAKQVIKISKNSEQNYFLFMEFVKVVNYLSYSNIDKDLLAIKFYLKILEIMGYKLLLDKCSNCGQKFSGKQYLNLDSGEVVCIGCRNSNYLEISNVVLTNLRIMQNIEYEKLNTLKIQNINITLNILKTNLEHRFN